MHTRPDYIVSVYEEGRIARVAPGKAWNPYLFDRQHYEYVEWERGHDGWPFSIGDRIIKDNGDYVFEGNIVAMFIKLNGRTIRIVAEDDRGLCFIFNPSQIRKV